MSDRRIFFLQKSIVNHLFTILNESSLLIEESENVTFLEALCLTGENILEDTVKQKQLKDKLLPLYEAYFQEGMTAEDSRRAYQLATLKGMKSGTQTTHQMTPDSLVLFLGYLVSKLISTSSVSLLDPAVGTGNLLTGVMNQLHLDSLKASGIEIDDLLVKLAYTNANLQQKDIQFYHQDALKPLYIDPVDVTICDVPVGVYPDELVSQTFELGNINEKSFSHYMFIEQGLNYTKPAGYLVYMVPNDLFKQDKDHVFHQFIKKNAVILGLLQLPSELFSDPKHEKSILIMQKLDDSIEPPKEMLLVQLPSFSKKEQMAGMIAKINHWFDEHLS